MASRYFGETPITGKMIADKIVEELPVDLDDMPHVWTLHWAGTSIQPQKPMPFDPFSMATWIFHDDTTIRVYTLGSEKPAAFTGEWKIRPAIRWTLTKATPDYVGEDMTIDVWIDAIIDECTQVVADMSSAEMEREAIADYIEGAVVAASDPTFEDLAAGIRAGDHNGDEDDDEDDTDEKPTVSPAIPIAPTVPNGGAPTAEAKP
jgi:hypothetical protein